VTEAGAAGMRSILVALDRSEHAAQVFAAAARLAKSTGAWLYLMRVLAVPPEIPPAANVPSNGLELELDRDARRYLRRFMEGEPAVRFGPPVVVVGDPWHQILDAARQLGVDLVVVGGHRRHGFERVLGTVADKVVDHADRDVLVVHTAPATRAPG